VRTDTRLGIRGTARAHEAAELAVWLLGNGLSYGELFAAVPEARTLVQLGSSPTLLPALYKRVLDDLDLPHLTSVVGLCIPAHIQKLMYAFRDEQ
jgi:hypothetical protein